VAVPKKKQKRRAIHDRLADLRRAAGLSQSQLAGIVGVDETAVSHWETGRSAPSGTRLEAVADALGVTVSDLFREAA
jgi:transcriptional regulator with XRE-family HTH domain